LILLLIFVVRTVQVIAWRTVSEMTYNVSSGMLNLTHSLTLCVWSVYLQQLTDTCSRHVEHVIQESSLDYVQDVQLARACKAEVHV